MEKAKKIIFGILTALLSIILIFNVYNFLCIKVLHKDLATINGYAILEVVSGSMEPTIHKGDMIIINTKEKDYKVTDIITFRDKEGSFVTHRLILLDKQIMVTRGDNNNTEDASYPTSAIVGKYVTRIAGAGVLLASFKNPFTMVMIFIIGILACVLLSTDKDGNPILDSEELEFQEYLKQKYESENKKESTKKVVKKETQEKRTTKKDKKTENEKKPNQAKKESPKNNAKNKTIETDSKKDSSKKTSPKTSNTKTTKKKSSNKKKTNKKKTK